MKVNYQSLRGATDQELEQHFEWLIRDSAGFSLPGRIGTHGRYPEDFLEGYQSVDVMGEELIWMNNTFPKEQFTWYLWFESVFLVPEEMLPLLILKWG